MYSDAEVYNRVHRMQARDARLLCNAVCPKMRWSDQDLVLDIGCGTGDNTRDILLPSIQELKLLLGFDVLKSMVDFAKINNAAEKIEYHVANIEDIKSFPRNWQGQISKAFAIHCFNWIKDQKLAFQNLFSLLAPGGEAAAIHCLSTPFWTMYDELVEDPKWKKYIEGMVYSKSFKEMRGKKVGVKKNSNRFVPASHNLGLRSGHYREMLEKIGFVVVTCEDEERTFAYEDDAECRSACSSRSAFTSHIPDDLKEEFKDDLLKYFVKYCGRNAAGQPVLRYTILTIHIKKP